jgi:electron-transferring-flavoprotein dehydrogenase
LNVGQASDFPPPFQPGDFVVAPSDPPDERIEVGVLVVGAGPAGLAFAVRFGQLLSEDPALAAQLGDVPLAVVEKGKQPGSHLLSGAILNPRSLQQLFAGRPVLDEMPSYGAVPGESVYVLTGRSALPIPTPPTMRNRGNVIVSLSQFGRWFAQQAEEAGAMMLPETAAVRLLVAEGQVVGVRSGDKGRGPHDEELSNFEPGSDLVARVTVLAEGTQGHLTGVALQHLGLQGEEPQVWELGVKEVWRVARPLDRVIHTMGWPLRPGARYREFGGSFIYPMGPDMLTIGMVVGLDYRDVSLSGHDLLQELKTHPKVRQLLDGGERIEWGAKTIPGGGFHALPKRLHAPGLVICGDGAGLVNIPTLKGIHYAIESGRLAAEATFAALQRAGQGAGQGSGPGPVPDLAEYDDLIRSSFIWQDLYEVRDMRQVFGRGFVIGGALAGVMNLTKGRVSVGKVRTEPDAAQPLLRTDRAARYPVPDGKLTFDKLSSVFASGNKTRDDQPDHIRIQHRVAPDVAELWVRTCPAQVYAAGETGPDGLTTVEVSASNCVQCGAITAKGGRLTPPEGGSGPEYTTT